MESYSFLIVYFQRDFWWGALPWRHWMYKPELFLFYREIRLMLELGTWFSKGALACPQDATLDCHCMERAEDFQWESQTQCFRADAVNANHCGSWEEIHLGMASNGLCHFENCHYCPLRPAESRLAFLSQLIVSMTFSIATVRPRLHGLFVRHTFGWHQIWKIAPSRLFDASTDRMWSLLSSLKKKNLRNLTLWS